MTGWTNFKYINSCILIKNAVLYRYYFKKHRKMFNRQLRLSFGRYQHFIWEYFYRRLFANIFRTCNLLRLNNGKKILFCMKKVHYFYEFYFVIQTKNNHQNMYTNIPTDRLSHFTTRPPFRGNSKNEYFHLKAGTAKKIFAALKNH